MGFLAILPTIGFFYLFFSGTRKIGAETFGDKIWWNNLRPIHGLLYGIFAYNAIKKNSYSWIFLLMDVCLGLTGFLTYHTVEGNFKELINMENKEKISKKETKDNKEKKST